MHIDQSELGKKSAYSCTYSPEKLFAIPRQQKRDEIGINAGKLPFYGFDHWNHYEVSWLNNNGKPMVAVAEISYSCDSINIIESKSMKLYFNSLNNTKFQDIPQLQLVIKQDLEKCIGASVEVKIIPLNKYNEREIYSGFKGKCLDELDITCSVYTVNSSFLVSEQDDIEEIVYSDLLKANCLVTRQPDWGSVQIAYKGKKINHEGLLKYLISFRNHNEFHEQCIERIFVDILTHCQPAELTVYGKFTRRGGLDINPYRTTLKNHLPVELKRLCRQ